MRVSGRGGRRVAFGAAVDLLLEGDGDLERGARGGHGRDGAGGSLGRHVDDDVDQAGERILAVARRREGGADLVGIEIQEGLGQVEAVRVLELDEAGGLKEDGGGVQVGGELAGNGQRGAGGELDVRRGRPLGSGGEQEVDLQQALVALDQLGAIERGR